MENLKLLNINELKWLMIVLGIIETYLWHNLTATAGTFTTTLLYYQIFDDV